MTKYECDYCERDLTDEARFEFRLNMTAVSAPMTPGGHRQIFNRQTKKLTTCIGCVMPEDLEQLPSQALTERFLTGKVSV